MVEEIKDTENQQEIKKDNETKGTGKKIDGWFIVRQILGFILTMLLAPMLFLGACFTGAVGWGSSSPTPVSVLAGFLTLWIFYIFFRSTRNYGVKVALVILAIFVCMLFFG